LPNYSTFTADQNYQIDQFRYVYNLPASQYANAILLNQLRALTNPTSDQISQINSLTIALQDYNVSPDQFNAFSQSVMNMEGLIKKIVDFKDMGVYSSLTTYTLWNTVQYNGQTFISKVDNNLNHTPTGISDSYWTLIAAKGASFIWRNEWSISTSYVANEAVHWNNSSYVCIIAPPTGTLPSNTTYWQPLSLGLVWLGEWSVLSTYVANNIVVYDGSSYICILPTTAGILPINTTYWNKLALKGVSIRINGAWETSHSYVNDSQYVDIVTFNGSSFYCIQSNTNQQPSQAFPPTDTAFWGVFTQIGSPGLNLVYMQIYNTLTSYEVNNVVSFNNALYYCTNATTGGIDPTDVGYWSLFLTGTGIPISANSPLSPSINQLWVNSTTKVISYWNGSSWVNLTASAITDGTLTFAPSDIANINIESSGYGTISGLTTTAQSTPNMTVNVATGTVHMANGVRYTPSANSTLAITTANATNPRIDIIYVNSSGVISYLAGTPASSPVVPTVPLGGFLLSKINVIANTTTITSTNITDMRKIKNTTDSNADQIALLSGVSGTVEKANKSALDTTNANVTNLNNTVAEHQADIAAHGTMARQAIINGNFDVWQRNTSVTNPVNASFLADRWKVAIIPDSGIVPTNTIHSRQPLTSGDISNAYYYYRINPDGAGSSFGANAVAYIAQLIENGTRYLCGDGKKVTVSFWARSSIAGKKIGVNLQQIYGTGDSPSVGENIIGTAFTLTSTWEKLTYTFATNTLAGKTFGTNNDDYIVVFLNYMWGSTRAITIGATGSETFGGSGNIDIAQIQVNSGDTALPFSPKTFEKELQDCMRYYERSFGLTSITGTRIVFGVSNANAAGFYFIVPKRVTPTISVYSRSGTVNKLSVNATGADIGTSVTALGASTTGIFLIADSGSGFTQNVAYECNYSADAEL